MEAKSDNVTQKSNLPSNLIQHTLKSWRFFLLFSVPPVLWVVFVEAPALPRLFIAVLCGMVWFGCWRLWLDTRYFTCMSEDNNALAGEALFVIWRREKLQRLTFAERQRGALKQFRRTMWLTGGLWIAWLAALL